MTATAREAVQGVIDFIATNANGATPEELAALAAYQADPEAAIERGVSALEQPTTEARVETFVMFSREQLRHAGAHFLAQQSRIAGVTSIDWSDWGTARRTSSADSR
jgi:hypothetical protein